MASVPKWTAWTWKERKESPFRVRRPFARYVGVESLEEGPAAQLTLYNCISVG